MENKRIDEVHIGRVLRPKEYSGDVHGDYGYVLDGKKSDEGYVSARGAEKALERAIDKLAQREWSTNDGKKPQL